MTRYTGPKAKLSRREDTNLFLESTRHSLTDKYKLDSKPGQHGRTSGARASDYGNQLHEKQKAERIYGVLGRQFRRYFAETNRRKGNMGETLLQLLESHLDNIVYHVGFNSTRAGTRQLVSHKTILMDGRALNVPSAQIRTGDMIAIHEKLKKQVRIARSLTLAEQIGFPTWVAVDAKKMEGTFKQIPDRADIAGDINESLIVELYSRQ